MAYRNQQRYPRPFSVYQDRVHDAPARPVARAPAYPEPESPADMSSSVEMSVSLSVTSNTPSPPVQCPPARPHVPVNRMLEFSCEGNDDEGVDIYELEDSDPRHIFERSHRDNSLPSAMEPTVIPLDIMNMTLGNAVEYLPLPVQAQVYRALQESLDDGFREIVDEVTDYFDPLATGQYAPLVAVPLNTTSYDAVPRSGQVLNRTYTVCKGQRAYLAEAVSSECPGSPDQINLINLLSQDYELAPEDREYFLLTRGAITDEVLDNMSIAGAVPAARSTPARRRDAVPNTAKQAMGYRKSHYHYL